MKFYKILGITQYILNNKFGFQSNCNNYIYIIYLNYKYFIYCITVFNKSCESFVAYVFRESKVTVIINLWRSKNLKFIFKYEKTIWLFVIILINVEMEIISNENFKDKGNDDCLKNIIFFFSLYNKTSNIRQSRYRHYEK